MATKETQNLRNKRILITAGPTWVPIDGVRVISNIATGKTGILLAEKLQHLGVKVTLLLGPVEACCLNKQIKLIRFNFFDELKDKLITELKSGEYDILIHSAAVSDYRPLKVYSRKIKSAIKKWTLDLIPTEKIIDLIKNIDRSLFTVGFKFEPEAQKNSLIKEAKALLCRSNLDLAVANTVVNKKYRAFIIDGNQIYGPLLSKEVLADKLIRVVRENLWKN